MTNLSPWVALLSITTGCGGVGSDPPPASSGGGPSAGGSGGEVGAGGVGTGSGGVEIGEGTVYTLDLTEFGTTEAPGALGIANETLAFPLTLGPTHQALSPAHPGDLAVVYTRVGCSVDPEVSIGTEGLAPIQLAQVPAVSLIEVTIDQFVGVGVTSTPHQLAESTCLTLKSRGGPWMPFLQPQKITLLSPDSVRAEFIIEQTDADSAAIFLPTYTYVSRISYRIQ